MVSYEKKDISRPASARTMPRRPKLIKLLEAMIAAYDANDQLTLEELITEADVLVRGAVILRGD